MTGGAFNRALTGDHARRRWSANPALRRQSLSSDEIPGNAIRTGGQGQKSTISYRNWLTTVLDLRIIRATLDQRQLQAALHFL
jgi:hypothetical protein